MLRCDWRKNALSRTEGVEMEPFNARLHTTIMARWTRMDDDERRATVAFLAGERPASVVRARDYAARLAREVEETLSES